MKLQRGHFEEEMRKLSLTHKQWAALWQLVYGEVRLQRLNLGWQVVTRFINQGRDITHLVSMLRKKGMVKYSRIGVIVTQRGMDSL